MAAAAASTVAPAAVTAESLAQTHQIGQSALASMIPAIVDQAWPLLDPHDLKGTLPKFIAAVQAVVQRYGLASASAALTYYRQERAAQGVTSSPGPLRVAESPSGAAVEDAVRGAVSNLYGPVTPESEAKARDAVAQAAQQLVLDQGRMTIAGAVGRDRAAKGWVRVTEVGACWFCTMLALRGGAGMLYNSRSSFRGSNARFKGSGEFKVHDNCHCTMQPVFTAYEPPARLREAQQRYNDATKGRIGHDSQVAFRQAWEGRPVTGTTGPRDSNGKLLLAPPSKKSTANQLRAQIKDTQSRPDSEWRRKRLKRLNDLLSAAGGK